MIEQIAAAMRSGLIKPGEVWLGHPRFPRYLIGVHGAVLSFVKKEPRILSPIRLGEYDGYQLKSQHGSLVKAYRHRLVAEVVHGPCPPGFECCHQDGNRANADFTNLRWATHLENEADKLLTGTRPSGERSGQAKLTDALVRQMRAMKDAQRLTYKEIGQRFGVSTMTAFRAVTGQTWKAVR